MGFGECIEDGQLMASNFDCFTGVKFNIRVGLYLPGEIEDKAGEVLPVAQEMD